MKIRQRALSILLALAMVLTFMPAFVFAEVNSQKPTGLEFQGDDFIYSSKYVNEELQESGSSTAFDDFFAEGNKLIVKYSDHNEVFEPRLFRYPDMGEDDGQIQGYFPEGEEPKFSDADGYWTATNSAEIEHSINKEGLVTITYFYGTEGESVSTTRQAREYNEPVSISYKGPALVYEPGDEEKQADIYNKGAVLTVTYKDGTTKTAECLEYATTNDNYPITDFFWKGEKPIVYKDEDGNYRSKNGLNEKAVLYSEKVSDNELKYTYEESFYGEDFKVSETLPVSERPAKWTLDVTTTRYVGDIENGLNVYDKNTKDYDNYATITDVKSGKKSVLTVKKSTFKDEKGKKQVYYWLDAKKVGKATITVKYKDASGKTGTLKKTITVKKYPNQIKSLKVNGKAVEVSENKYFLDSKTGKTSVKIKMALKKGWKIKNVEAYAYTKNYTEKKISATKKAISKGSAISFPKKYKELHVTVNMSKGKDVVSYTFYFYR